MEGHRGSANNGGRMTKDEYYAWRIAKSSLHGIHLRLSKKDERKVRKKLKGKQGKDQGFQILATQGDGVHFTTRELRLLSNKYCNYAKLFEQKQEEVVKGLLKNSLNFRGGFEKLAGMISKLDILTGFAHVSAARGYTRPSVGPLLRGMKLTCNSSLGCETSNIGCHGWCFSVVPNSIEFSSRNPHEEEGDDHTCVDRSVFILTGPNMGGKSTFLKTVGSIAFMAHLGTWVPATVARVPILDRIFMRAGSRDYLSAGCSTFMNEMISISGILAQATHTSLVLIDELGRGTSAWDGLGLAWAVAADLVERRVPCVFATHFHELKDVPGAQNLHVGAVCNEADGVAMTYRVSPGFSPFSFGLEVARAVGFPETVVSRASELLNSYEEDESGAQRNDLGSAQ